MSWLLVGLLVSAVHLTESFEGTFPPAGWSVLDLGTQNNDTWERTSQIARTGLYSAAVFYGPQGIVQDEWLITPPLDLSGVSQVYLLFYEDEEYWSGYGDHHRIRVCTTDPSDTANFEIVMDMTPYNHNIAGFDGDPVMVDLSAYAGQSQVYIALQYTGIWADNWFVDDITVYSPEPHDVSAEAIGLPLFVKLNEPYTPQVEVQNWGMNTETFSVALVGYRGNDLFYTDTVTVTSLAPNQSQQVSFTSLTFTEGGANNAYRFVARTLLPGDGEPNNDTAVAEVYAFSQPRRVLLELTTNTGCGPCKPANDTLDVLMEDLGSDLATVRYHAWWPSSSDPFYQANISENTARIEYYGADYAPHLHIDGTLLDGDAEVSSWRSMITNEIQEVPAGVELQVSGYVDTVSLDGFVVAEITDHDGLPYSQMFLRVALVEDSLYYPSPNGQTWHFQVMRDMVPDPVGFSLSLAPGETVVETVAFSVDPSWNWRHCEIVVFVQDDETRHAVQANRLLLTQMTAVAEASAPQARIALRTPGLVRDRLRFTVEAGRAGAYEVEVYDAAGRRVWHRGFRIVRPQEVPVTVSPGMLPTGVYLVRLSYAGHPVQKRRVVLVR